MTQYNKVYTQMYLCIQKDTGKMSVVQSVNRTNIIVVVVRSELKLLYMVYFYFYTVLFNITLLFTNKGYKVLK